MLPKILRKRCIKRRFQGIHHRFVNDPEFRASQLEHGRTEEVCIQMDEACAKRVLSSYDASKNTFDTETIGGSLSIILEDEDR